MNNIYIRISDRRLWIINYNTACAIIFIPLTTYVSYKLRKRRLARKNKLEREHKIQEFQKLYRILIVSGSSLSSVVLLKILLLRGGEDIVIPGVEDCIDIEKPSYIDNERILRFINDKFSKFNINGIIYITKEALCYLVKNEGLVDFPIVFLERIKIDGVYSFVKVFSEWTTLSLGIIAAVARFNKVAIILGYLWLYINAIEISQPSVTEVEKLTGKYVRRIGDRKDSIVFDATKEPLPPIIEKSIKPVKIETLDTEYEITERNLVDIAKVSRLKNKFADRRFKRPNRKQHGKVVYFIDKIKEWVENSDDNKEPKSVIDKMLEEGIL